MADRTFASDLKTPGRGLVAMDFRVSMLAGTSGVDATTSSIPLSFVTVARTGVGIITITLLDAYVDVVTFGATLGNSGAWLAAFSAQPSGTTYSVTAKNSTLTLHVGNATVLADPGAAYNLHVNLILRNSAQVP